MYGSEIYNYKSTISIILFNLADTDYNFLYADQDIKDEFLKAGYVNTPNCIKNAEHLNEFAHRSGPARKNKRNCTSPW